ncbi:hypothetical protein DFH06DRAFT_1296951 [Mycena polygramma]|nr:hypothetical protein DFH06DRAFT_1296951 [Mycena polygramma]
MLPLSSMRHTWPGTPSKATAGRVSRIQGLGNGIRPDLLHLGIADLFRFGDDLSVKESFEDMRGSSNRKPEDSRKGKTAVVDWDQSLGQLAHVHISKYGQTRIHPFPLTTMLPIDFLCLSILFRALIPRPGQLTWSGKRKRAFPTGGPVTCLPGHRDRHNCDLDCVAAEDPQSQVQSQGAKHNSSTGLTPPSAFCSSGRARTALLPVF